MLKAIPGDNIVDGVVDGTMVPTPLKVVTRVTVVLGVIVDTSSLPTRLTENKLFFTVLLKFLTRLISRRGRSRAKNACSL